MHAAKDVERLPFRPPRAPLPSSGTLGAAVHSPALAMMAMARTAMAAAGVRAIVVWGAQQKITTARWRCVACGAAVGANDKLARPASSRATRL